jgi:hypothetical protein
MDAQEPGATEQREGARPRWVKVFGVVAAVVAVLFVVSLLFGGGAHGPGRHLPGGGDPPAGADGGLSDHTPPEGVHP